MVQVAAQTAPQGQTDKSVDALFLAFSSTLPTLTVLTDRERLTPFETDAFISHRVVPLCVVLPDTEAQIAQIMRICARLGVPVVTRGAGTGIAGGAIPLADGVLLVMTKLNKILAIDGAARIARVQPGVRNLSVSDAVTHLNLFYAPDPSSQIVCSIGGNVAENSGGVHCLKYGLTTHNIRRAKCITAEGDAVTIGSHALDAAGYDLLALLTGSEGMLAVITEVTVKLTPSPSVVETLLAAFSTVEQAAECVGEIIGAGIIPAALEMMDQIVVQACERFMAAGFPTDAKALLLCELDGSAEEVAAETDALRSILERSGATEIRRAGDDVARAKLWRARKGAFAALANIQPDYYTIDGTIPRRCLPEVLRRYAALGAQYGMLVANVFHAGDGNLHPCIFYDGKIAGEAERSEELGGKMLEICIEVGGTITGEHGVGIEKLKQMCVQFRSAELAMFHAVKEAFDPNRILNPDKGIPLLKRCSEWGGMHASAGRIIHPDIPRF
jgi:glycolate oxidase